MRTDYNTGKAQKTSRVNCSICVRSYHDSLVGPCPERDGRQVCMYCCRMCGNSYKGFMGWGCRVKDEARKSAGAKKKGSLPQSPAAPADRTPTAARRVPSREDAPSEREPGTEAWA